MTARGTSPFRDESHAYNTQRKIMTVVFRMPFVLLLITAIGVGKSILRTAASRVLRPYASGL